MLGIAWALMGDRRVGTSGESIVDREESSPGCYFREEVGLLSKNMGKFVGREVKENTEFTVKKRTWITRTKGGNLRFPFVVTAHLASGKKDIFMDNFVHIAQHMQEKAEVVPRFSEMTRHEKDFLRRVLWDIHNFEQELHVGYVRLIEALEPKAPRPIMPRSSSTTVKGSTTTV